MDVSDPQFAKCICQTCSGHIEFDRAQVREMADCPHCGLETKLYVPALPLPSRGMPVSQAATRPAPAKAQEPEKLSREAPRQLYFYKSNDGEKGPYTEEQLRSLWANGIITANAVYRADKSSEWVPLCDSPIVSASQLGQMARRIPPLRTVQQWAFKGICLLSMMAFFLTNVRISVPIVGKINFSMFSFIAPQSQSPSAHKEMPRPNIKALFGTDGAFHLNPANAGQVIFAVALLGLLLHYLLTLVWAITTFGFKKSAPPLVTIWLVLAIQFPILFSLGTRLILARATSEAMNELKDNPFGVLGVAFTNNVSVVPGVVMWLLMLLCLAALTLPLVARKMLLPREEHAPDDPPTARQKSTGAKGWWAFLRNCRQDSGVDMSPRVRILSIIALAFGFIACLFCWFPRLGHLAIPLAFIGLLLASAGIIIASIKRKRGFLLPISGGIVCLASLFIAFAQTGGLPPAFQKALGVESWTRSRSVKQGDIIVTIERVEMKDVNGNFGVHVSVANLSTTKKVNFTAWRGEEVTLLDNYKNHYKNKNISGRGTGSSSIYPQTKSVTWLSFERPVANIEWLHLKLPAENFGGDGMLRFEIHIGKLMAAWEEYDKANKDFSAGMDRGGFYEYQVPKPKRDRLEAAKSHLEAAERGLD